MSLRLDWEYARRGYGRYAAYPAATIAGVFTNVVFGFLRAYILLALFEHRDEIGGYDTGATVTYTWLTQALATACYLWGWTELALRIRSGDIATDLVRPVHPLRAGLAFDLGRAAYHAVFRGLPPLAVGALVFQLTFPSSAFVWLAFLASVGLAVVVSYAFRALYNLAAFWLLDHRGPALIAMTTATLFSGLVVPIAFFPDWLAAIAWATPFPAMLQVPVDIFVGATDGAAIAGALAFQAFWAVALLLIVHGVFALGVRRLVVQGG